MRVLMVSANTAVSPCPVYPLGCAAMASALERDGHEVRQTDILAAGGGLDTLLRELQAFDPDVVGVSLRNIDNVNILNEKHYVRTAAQVVRTVHARSRAMVVMGGAGFSLLPAQILDATGADYGVAGEGEAAFCAFLRKAGRGVYPHCRIIGPETGLRGMDIPAPLHDPAVMGHYLRHGGVAPVQSKRGCPHGCVYCAYPLIEGRAIRALDPSMVVDEIERLTKDFGAKHVFFVDSVFNDSGGAHLDLLKTMKRRGVRAPWTGFIRPAGLTDEAVELMAATGMEAAEIGSDAASDATLKGMGKGFTLGDVRAATATLRRHGVPTAHFFMFGGPGETPETVREGIETVASLEGCVCFVYAGVRILPGTPLARLAADEGAIAREAGLLESSYYFSPSVGRAALEAELRSAFSGLRSVVFPPDAMDDTVGALHSLGHTGPLWPMLAPRAEQGLGK